MLVHGAFADSSSWDQEIQFLQNQGYPVIAVANPLRDVGSDLAYLLSVLKTIPGPIVLVGHSYAGTLPVTLEQPDADLRARSRVLA